MKSFKPMLAPNQLASFVPTNNPKKFYVGDIYFPILASYKLDGIRCEFIKGEMLSRSLKPIQNKQLREKFQPLIDYSRENNMILDGEIYTPEIPFSLISSCVMTQDYTDKKSIKTWLEKCEEYGLNITREEAFDTLKFYMFDVIKEDILNQAFIDRIKVLEPILKIFPNLIEMVKQVIVLNGSDINKHFEKALEDDYEGLILKSLEGRYKCGRGTLKEGLIYKIKPFVTLDAEIIEVLQATKVKDGIEKTVNELGRSVTSKKKDDRELDNMVANFVVRYEDTTVEVSCSRMSHKQRKEVWENKESYIGKTIEYKFMKIGLKDKPRSPNWVRFREDK